jgi:hypothetical protein
MIKRILIRALMGVVYWGMLASISYVSNFQNAVLFGFALVITELAIANTCHCDT